MNENPGIEPIETPRQPPKFWKLFLAGAGMAFRQSGSMIFDIRLPR